LIYDFVHAGASCNVVTLQHGELHGFGVPLDGNVRNSVFTGDPFRSIIESCKRKLVLYLLKFGIGEGFAVKLLLISALKYLPDVVP